MAIVMDLNVIDSIESLLLKSKPFNTNARKSIYISVMLSRLFPLWGEDNILLVTLL